MAKKEKLAIVSGHSNTNYYCYSCLIGETDDTDQFYNAQMATTKLVGYQIDQKNNKIKLSYSPTNKFNLSKFK